MNDEDPVGDAFKRWMLGRQRWTDSERDAFFASLAPETLAQLRLKIEQFELARLVITGAEHPGQEIGRFRLIDVMGQGGAGVVWKAEDLNTGELVAIKLLSYQRAESEVTRDRLNREAAILAQFDHPGIVRFIDKGEHVGLPYVVVELIDPPKTLRNALKDWKASGAFDEAYFREVSLLFESMCRALDYAHMQGVLHRDLSPANVLIDSKGQPRLTDFGLAIRPTDPHFTVANQILGTQHYMSPERVRPSLGNTSERSDIFSMGVMLFEVLTGQLPFDAADFDTYREQLLRGDPKRASRLQEKVPRELERIAALAMEHAVSRRYSSARAMADDLRAYLDSKRLAWDPNRGLSWLARMNRKHHRLGAILGVLGLAVLGVHQVIERVNDDADDRVQEVQDKAQLHMEELDFRSNLREAKHNVTKADWSTAQQSLKKIPENLRRWEWYYLMGQCDDTIDFRHIHSGPIFALKALPKRGLLSGGIDGRIVESRPVIDLDGRIVDGPAAREIDTHSAVYDLDYNASTGWLVSAGESGYITVWNESSSMLWQSSMLKQEEANLTVWCGWTGQGTFFSCAKNGSLKTWSQSAELEFTSVGNWDVTGPVEFHQHSESIVALTKNSKIQHWDLVGDKSKQIDPSCSAIWNFALAMNSDNIAVMDNSGSIYKNNHAKGKWPETQLIGAPRLGAPLRGAPRAMAYSPLGQMFAYTDSADSLYINDERTGFEVQHRGGHGWIEKLAFSHDGRMIYAGNKNGDVFTWLTATPRPGPEIFSVPSAQRAQGPRSTGVLRVLEVNPKGSLCVVGAGAESTYVISTKDGSLKRRHTEHFGFVSSIAFARDTDRMITGGRDKLIHIYDSCYLPAKGAIEMPGEIRMLTLSADGRELAAVTKSGDLFLRQVDGGQTMEINLPTKSQALDCAFDGNDSLFILTTVAGGEPSAPSEWVLCRMDRDQISGQWESTPPEEILRREGAVCAAELNTGDLSAIACRGGEIVVFNTRAPVSVTILEEQDEIVDITVSAKQERVFVATLQHISVWSLKSKKKNLQTSSPGEVVAIGMGRKDDSCLYLAGKDGSVLMWQAERSYQESYAQANDLYRRLAEPFNNARLAAVNNEADLRAAIEGISESKLDREFMFNHLKAMGPVTSRELDVGVWLILNKPGADKHELDWALHAARVATEGARGGGRTAQPATPPAERYRSSLHTLGAALCSLERWEEALVVLEEANKLDYAAFIGIGTAFTHAYLAQCYLLLGDTVNAELCYIEAEKLGKTDGDSLTKFALQQMREKFHLEKTKSD